VSRALLLAAFLAAAAHASPARGENIPVNDALADMVEEVGAATGMSLNIVKQTPTSLNINKVNGRNVCSADAGADVETLQRAFDRHPNIHRNIGPALVTLTKRDGTKIHGNLDLLRRKGILAGCTNIYVSVRE
jgi:hypothetical protein